MDYAFEVSLLLQNGNRSLTVLLTLSHDNFTMVVMTKMMKNTMRTGTQCFPQAQALRRVSLVVTLVPAHRDSTLCCRNEASVLSWRSLRPVLTTLLYSLPRPSLRACALEVSVMPLHAHTWAASHLEGTDSHLRLVAMNLKSDYQMKQSDRT